jgi:sulfatase maturation enzyme AslB (radical SAM superfamily)
VDLCSPCGAGRNVLSYLPNGDIYACDEARMLREEMFKLGNITKNRYREIVKSPNLFYTCESSLLNIWDYNSTFLAWSGTCPVLNYYEQGSPVVKINQTPRKKINDFQFRYIFDKIIHEPEVKDIFYKWAISPI